MNVRELNNDELEQLRWDYFYNLPESEREERGLYIIDDVTDAMLFEFYDGIDFVKDDFFCNVED